MASRKLPTHLGWAIVSLVFGLFLLNMGHRLHLFEGQGRWFAMTVFVLAWLCTVLLLGRYIKSNRPPDGDDDDP